jgi:hypothetical protein
VSLQVVAECVVLVSIVLLFASLSPGIFRMLASAKKSAVHVREPSYVAADIADARLQATALAAQASSNLVAKHQKQDKKFAEDILVSEPRFGIGGADIVCWGRRCLLSFFCFCRGSRKQPWMPHSEAVVVLPVFEVVVAIVMVLMVLSSLIQLPNCRNLKMRVIRVIFVVFITFLLRTAFSLLNSIGNVGYDYRYVSSSLLPALHPSHA